MYDWGSEHCHSIQSCFHLRKLCGKANSILCDFWWGCSRKLFELITTGSERVNLLLRIESVVFCRLPKFAPMQAALGWVSLEIVRHGHDRLVPAAVSREVLRRWPRKCTISLLLFCSLKVCSSWYILMDCRLSWTFSKFHWSKTLGRVLCEGWSSPH